MIITPPRYQVVASGNGDGWIVFDTFAQKPAATDPSELISRALTKEAAIRACARLNRAYTMAHDISDGSVDRYVRD